MNIKVEFEVGKKDKLFSFQKKVEIIHLYVLFYLF